jgi:aminoglycoside 6'-N-acetyltransferase
MPGATRPGGSLHLGSGRLTLRPLDLEDFPRFLQWVQDPDVARWRVGIERASDAAGVRRHDFEDAEPGAHRDVLEKASRPVGYVQWGPLEAEARVACGYPTEAAVFGIDLFRGEPGSSGRGLGAGVVRAVAEHIRRCHGAYRGVLDPGVENARAIRAYEKAGFRVVRRLPAHPPYEDPRVDCWLMEFEPEPSARDRVPRRPGANG